ncbi:hypothetical protein [Luteimonas sp. MHLX1A]|uniref:hypothetical protein n=1 Tax=Alterluteimonas muca TaxID=2878684 RepID=UPI001E2FC422|nr:hypothetical protein [Luteimonas sp. MHLX1A]MCD9046926.1 hypothetical protein [Luteimonas sp. MHLX1A]
MLALLTTNSNHDELYLTSGRTVPVPKSGCSLSVQSLDVALRYAYKAGLITHQEFLVQRDLLIEDEV